MTYRAGGCFCPKIIRICPSLGQVGTAWDNGFVENKRFSVLSHLSHCPTVFSWDTGREAPTLKRTSTFPQVEIFKEPDHQADDHPSVLYHRLYIVPSTQRLTE